MSALLQELDLKAARACAAFSLKSAARAVSQAYDEALQPAGLRSTQFALLVAVAANQPAAVGEIATVMFMDQTTTTRSLRLLARAGLVEIPARGPKREKRVRLTAEGERKLRRAVPVWRAAQERFTDAFGQQKWRETVRALRAAAALTYKG